MATDTLSLPKIRRRRAATDTILCRAHTQHYTILYYTILYYTILYYTILYYTILYYTILYIYIERERGREGDIYLCVYLFKYLCVYTYVCMCVYVYIYIYITLSLHASRTIPSLRPDGQAARLCATRSYTFGLIIATQNATTTCVPSLFRPRSRNTSEVVVRRALGLYFQQGLLEI